jgi:effector-binding domain-containing protein
MSLSLKIFAHQKAFHYFSLLNKQKDAMYTKIITVSIFFSFSLLMMLSACNHSGDSKKNQQAKKDTVIKTAIKREEPSVVKKAPVINIMDTLSIKQMVLCIKDSAATSGRIALKLGQIYGVKLAAIIKKEKLKVTGPPMAWYKSSKAPFFFEAGLPVDRKPAKLPANAIIKQMGQDSVIVAHFYGPYDLTDQAYTALQEWMKDHKKKSILPPYEVYVDDPLDKNGKLKDPYKVQTDIIFTWR